MYISIHNFFNLFYLFVCLQYFSQKQSYIWSFASNIYTSNFYFWIHEIRKNKYSSRLNTLYKLKDFVSFLTEMMGWMERHRTSYILGLRWIFHDKSRVFSKVLKNGSCPPPDNIWWWIWYFNGPLLSTVAHISYCLHSLNFTETWEKNMTLQLAI